MRIVTVFTSRPHHLGTCEYAPKHVQALQKQVEKWAPGVEFECITNTKIDGVKTVAPRNNWPGWWLKMNLFDPRTPADFLFVDLDTVITGPLDDILARRELTLLRDFYRDGKKLKEGLGSGLMYIPAGSRRDVWNMWQEHPELMMRVYPRGDQFLLEKFFINTAKRWQDVVPGQVVSWKVNCRNDVVPDPARVVCFHGKPRPWEVGKFAPLYR